MLKYLMPLTTFREMNDNFMTMKTMRNKKKKKKKKKEQEKVRRMKRN